MIFAPCAHAGDGHLCYGEHWKCLGCERTYCSHFGCADALFDYCDHCEDVLTRGVQVQVVPCTLRNDLGRGDCVGTTSVIVRTYATPAQAATHVRTHPREATPAWKRYHVVAGDLYRLGPAYLESDGDVG